MFYFSGYGSQALSSNTLSSDDSMSLRSISVDGTPDTELIPRINEDFKAKVTMQQPLEASQKGHHRPTAASLASTAGAGDLLSPPDIRYHSYTTLSLEIQRCQNVQICPKMAKNGQKWPKIVKKFQDDV